MTYKLLSFYRIHEEMSLPPYSYRPVAIVDKSPQLDKIYSKNGIFQLRITNNDLYDGDVWGKLYTYIGDPSKYIIVLRTLWYGVPYNNGEFTINETNIKKLPDTMKNFYRVDVPPLN